MQTSELTPANTDDRIPVPDLTQALIGKLFGNRGYISQCLLEELYQRGLELVTYYKVTYYKKTIALA